MGREHMSKVPRPGQSSVAFYLAAAVVGSGVIFRIAQYTANRSLWIDEARLALNVVNRSFLELSKPFWQGRPLPLHDSLTQNQGAPIGFLFLQKLAIQVLGNHDYILRSVPLVAGIVSLLLMYKAASRLLGTAGMLVATALFAVSNPLVYYASEAKQYSGDALATLVLVLVAYKCFETQPCPRCYFCLIAGGVACMWISHPCSIYYCRARFGSGCQPATETRSTTFVLAWISLHDLAAKFWVSLLYFLTPFSR